MSIRRNKILRMFVLALAFVMAFSIIPGFSQNVYAASEKEPNNDAIKATPINVGTSYDGKITKSGEYSYSDADWYKFTINKDGKVNINLSFSNVNTKEYFNIHLYDANRKNILYSQYVSKKKSGTVKSAGIGLAHGTYYFKVDSSSMNAKYNFKINFTASTQWEKEPNDTFAQANKIAVNKAYSAAAVDYSDKGYYKFTLKKNDYVTVSLNHPKLSGFYEIEIFDKNKKKLQYEFIDSETAGSYKTPVLSLKKGDYYVMVDPALDAAETGKTYSFTVNTGQKSKKSIKKASVSGIVPTYNKGTQNPTVKLNGKTLKKDRDYVLTYEYNTKYGYGTVYITGKGDYVDYCSRGFTLLTGLERISGSDRYITANKIAARLKKLNNNKKFNAIVVAAGNNYPDALGGVFLAKSKNAPIILTKDGKHDDTVKYIKSNLASGGTVYILGGEGVVSKAFAQKLKKAGIKYTRKSGSDRYETNIKTLSVTGIKNKELLVCTGRDFADALISSAAGRPIMIVKPTGLSKSQKNYLKKNKPKSITIIGNTSSVPAKIATELKSASGVKPTRVTASNKYEMSTKVAKKYFKNPKSVVIATGGAFADALAGGPLAIKMGGPLLLVGDNQSQYKYAKAYVKDNKIKQGVLLGGTGAVSDNTSKQILK